MLAKKKSVTLSEEKISGEEIMPSTAEEWKNFKEEIQRQIEQGNKIIDFGKATRNAKYLTKLDQAFADTGGTIMTFEEMERLVNA